MTATTASQPHLIGIEATAGACDRCDKELTRRRYLVRDGERVLTLGQKCAAKVTGWKPNEVERQARMAARAVVLAERREQITANFPTLTSAQVGDVIASDWAWRDDKWQTFAEQHAVHNGR